ncbi:MAG: hypothetical protein IJ523_02895 [Succinivibrionaceae bacterium]|nr:hypothetical protein [Succinivibrionaceae bacterium]
MADIHQSVPMVATEEELAEMIFREYAAYLEQVGVRYSYRQRAPFYVYVPLTNIDKSFTHVCRYRRGEIQICDYCGICYTGIRLANRVAKAIRERSGSDDIVVERYGEKFELDIYHTIQYTGIEALHQAVLDVAHVADFGFGIGKEMLGEQFVR